MSHTVTPPAPLGSDIKIISLVGFAHGISHFFHLILAPLFPWIKDAFQLTYAELGFLMTVFFVVSAIGQAFAGFVVDRIGARNVLFFGVACLGLGALVSALAPSYTVLCFGSILAGVGNSVFHPADYTLLNKKVSTARLAHAFSVHGLTGNIGWAAAPVFLVTIAKFSDWRTALFAAACLPLLALFLLFLNRDELKTIEGMSTSSPSVANDSKKSDGLFSFLGIPAVWLCFGFFFMISMALGGIQSFSASALQFLYGMKLEMATLAYTLYMLSAALGMVWGGIVASKQKQHEKTISGAFIVAAIVSLMISMGWLNAYLALAGMAIVGFAAGVAGPSRDLLIRSAAPKNATGRVYGMVYSGLDSGLAVSPLLFGLIMDGHRPDLIFLGIAIFQIGAMLMAQSVARQISKSVST